jgi:L-ascorbate metabolism protein UlaG (beta-lactamase superfamily)
MEDAPSNGGSSCRLSERTRAVADVLAVAALLAAGVTQPASAIGADGPSQTAPPTARPALVLTYVANSGVLVAAGDRKILIDALFDRPNPAYRAPSSETIDRMVNGIAPFDGVTAALVTHNHPDHFDPRVALRFLESRRDAVLVAPADAVAAMRSAAADWPQVAPRVIAIEGSVGDRGMHAVRGVSVTTFRTRHGSSETPPNLMYLVDLNRWRLFHEGDSPGDVEEYKRFGLGTERVDLALVHQWFAFEPACAAFLQQVLRPDHIALTHLPIDREVETPAKLDAVRKSHIDIFLLLPGMAPKEFPGDHQAAPPTTVPAGYAITGVGVVDVEKGLVRSDQRVIVVGDRIQHIGLGASVPVQKNLRVIDGTRLLLTSSHSPRNARTGSTREARHAGHPLAAKATSASPALTAANVVGSVGGTPYRKSSTSVVAASAAASPTTIPGPTIQALRVSTCATIVRDRAPRLIRTPISCVRWAT